MNILNKIFGAGEEVNKKDLRELHKEGAVIMDVRSRSEFDGGHIKGAINIPVDTLATNLTKLGDKDSYIITCCASGGRSSIAKSILTSAGYKNVHNGGGWQSLRSKIDN
jgi:rhodanese-related sulfurtransferase